ncbi:PhnD/SsuA/transferrin family substrate-binding protein [uncultured Sulfitobacter sp.]|uniref:phosphate/phosphite/phosphonate ABC transporter substrate-binding protein n=1 Tax=uncultured Sulfitobacter sp. TaxID=191468 RepID=UPI0026244032|nr:PhnD/SsuA/transferrin family substrate-binding protein [uncultured Sulfitobacter sp.]
MIANLTMYARPELETAHVQFWASIHDSLAQRGVEAPLKLTQNVWGFEVWEDPTLVLSQTCGMPYRTCLHGHVQIIGTPDYGLEGCPAGYYNSAIIVRADDARASLSEFASARLTYNASHSQSGFAALYNHTKPLDILFSDRVVSGGHLASAKMVAQRQADIASIDAQTWRLISRYEPIAAQLRVLEYTTPTPGLPYITGLQHDPNVIYDAVSEAISMLPAPDATALDLHGLVQIGPAKYLAVPNPPASAAL